MSEEHKNLKTENNIREQGTVLKLYHPVRALMCYMEPIAKIKIILMKQDYLLNLFHADEILGCGSGTLLYLFLYLLLNLTTPQKSFNGY